MIGQAGNVGGPDRQRGRGGHLRDQHEQHQHHRLATATDRPDRFMGLHFFSPVPVMGLIEIIRGLETGEESYRACLGFAAELGKTVIESKDYPGFLVNRMLGPFINEAIFALMESTGSAEDIDTGARLGLNHPMGPLELSDFIGNDVMLGVMDVLYRGFGDPKFRAARCCARWSPPDTWAGRRDAASIRTTSRGKDRVTTEAARRGDPFALSRRRSARSATRCAPRAQAELAPAAAQRDEDERYDRGLFERAAELGLAGLPAPRSTAGRGWAASRGPWRSRRSLPRRWGWRCHSRSTSLPSCRS